MTKEELKTKALKYIESCKSAMEQDQLQNAEKMKRYNGDLYGNEVKGRSQVVMTDVADTIEWVMPSLMRIFYGSEDIVKLNPEGPEDEEKAKLMEQKVNYDFQRGINGFGVLHDFFKDALLQKKGVVKYRWEKKASLKTKEYSGLSDIEFTSILMNPNSEILEHNQPLPGTHDVKIREKIVTSKPIVENLPSEEFIYLPTARSLSQSEFVAHKKRIHKNKLKKYKIEEDRINDEIKAFEDDPAYQERFNDLGGINFITPDKDTDEVWLYECYLNDYTDDGEEISKKLTLVGSIVADLEDNPFGKPPFCVCSPIRMSHRMVGRDIAELVLEIQKLRTALMRYILDNIYFQNNGMKVVNPFRISVDQLLNNNVPGGIATTLKDTNPNEGIFNVPIAPLPPHIMNIMEYVEMIKENRTGITKYNQGLDSKSLNRTASGISQIMNAARERVEMIARVFAESEDGVKGIFRALVDMNLMFFDRAQNIKINDKWITLNPQMIDGQFDIMIDIGSGTGSKEIKVNQLMMMLDRYTVAAPALPDMITKQNIYNIFAALWENLGFKNASLYITPPQQGDAPAVTPPPQEIPQGEQPQIPQGPPPEMMPPMPQDGGMVPQMPPMPQGMPMQPPMNMPMPMQDFSPFESRLMGPVPPLPPEPQVIVNMPAVNVAPPSINIGQPVVNIQMPEQKEAEKKILTPTYDEEGKIVNIVSEAVG